MPLARSGPPVRNTAHPGLVRARGVLRSINAAPIPKYRPPLHATASLLPQAHCGVSEFPRPYQPIAELESRLQFLSDPQPIGYTAPEEKHGMARRARRRRIKRIGLACLSRSADTSAEDSHAHNLLRLGSSKVSLLKTAVVPSNPAFERDASQAMLAPRPSTPR